jgi:metal-responsive CopG/Arc/MetJ family transcriptional regulator
MFTIPKYDSTHVCINSDTSMIKYVTVKLPTTLAEQIDEILEKQNLGYTSRAELVKEAVRTFISTKTKNP